MTGFKERSVLIFRQRYLKAGLEGLEHKRKGKPKRLLSQSQRDEIINFLTLTTPKEHGHESDFWSTSVGTAPPLLDQKVHKIREFFTLVVVVLVGLCVNAQALSTYPQGVIPKTSAGVW